VISQAERQSELTTFSDEAVRVPWTKRRRTFTAGVIIYSILFLVSLWYIGFSPAALIAGGSDSWALLQRMLPPQFGGFGNTISLAVETFFMAVLGTALALALSLPLAYLAANNTSPGRAISGAARGLIVFFRAVPDLVFALIFVRVLGIGILPGVLALGLHSIGMLGKLFTDAIEESDPGPTEAVASSGAGWLQQNVASIFPQIQPIVVGMSLYRLDINVRLSTVLGFVGAGGIGLKLKAMLGNLRYDQALGIVLVILVMIIAVEFFSSAVRRSLVGQDMEGVARSGEAKTISRAFSTKGLWPRRFRNETSDLDFDRGRVRPPRTRERTRRAVYWVLLIGTVVSAFAVVRVNPLEIPGALPKLSSVMARFLPPDFGLGWILFEAMLETVAIGIAATGFGIALSLPFGFLAARNIAPRPWVYFTTRIFLVVERAIPELIIAVLFVAAVGLGPFPGVLALVFGTVGFAAKLFADNLEEVDEGPREAITSTGARNTQEIAAAVVPQAMPNFIATSLYLLDINIRSAVVLGIVGAGGIGFLLLQSIRTLNFAVTSAILVLVFVVVYTIERLASWLRKMII
jgi:phosphonate transport system permease protein